MIVCRGVTLVRPAGARVVLVGVTFAVRGGEVVALLGSQGSGKSAVVRVLAGLAVPTGGAAQVCGAAAHTAAGRRHVAYLPAEGWAPPELSAREWLEYVAAHRGGHPAARLASVRAALDLAGLHGVAHQRLITGGRERLQRLALATVAASGRPVALFDDLEPAGDPAARAVVTDGIALLAQQGRAVVLASNDVATVERVATRVLLLARGHLVADLRMAELLQERVAELTLTGGGLRWVPRLHARYPDAIRTGEGVAVPLHSGRTLEAVLASCRAERIPVAGSRLRYRALDDLVLARTLAQGRPLVDASPGPA
ncbi:MAG: ATP-binding cassette domain-containing protein [Gemmatimonadota bacterium]|nr:ATP-binding cassette domain-containing protein [Gemmatimonadota bacterium]